MAVPWNGGHPPAVTSLRGDGLQPQTVSQLLQRLLEGQLDAMSKPPKGERSLYNFRSFLT